MSLRKRCLFLILIVILVCLTFLREWQFTAKSSGHIDNKNKDGYHNEVLQWRDTRHPVHGGGQNDDDDVTASLRNELGAAQGVVVAAAAATTSPSFAPSTGTLPTSARATIPPELIPKLPQTPAFNFTLSSHKESNGCFVNMTGDATLTHFPIRHRLDNLVEILQAGVFQPMTATIPSRRRKKAICKFRKIGNYMHFPHMMQEFTRCFSFFQTYSNHIPYMVKASHRRYRYPFNKGINDIFKDVFGGRTSISLKRVLDENSLVVRPAFDPGYDEGPQQGIQLQKPEHAELLRRKTAEYYNISIEGCQPGKDYPVIGILNRGYNSTRTLLNAERLRSYLSKMTDRPVEIKYFEGTEFLEQISFMMQTDIVISPHGAQLTSINFIPSCGGVFEIFPPGYWFPHFFGPLAASSGLSHGYVYTGHDLKKEWIKGGLNRRSARAAARKLDVCAPLQTSLEVIGQMVDNWKTCCHESLKNLGEGGGDIDVDPATLEED